MLVEREIGDDPLQAGTLVLQLAQAPQLVQARVRVLLTPLIERRFTHSELAHTSATGIPARLTQRVGYLLFRELRALHRSLPFLRSGTDEAKLTLGLNCRALPGRRHLLASSPISQYAHFLFFFDT